MAWTAQRFGLILHTKRDFMLTFTDAAPGGEERFDMLHLPRIWMAKEFLIRAAKRGHTIRPSSIVASTGEKGVASPPENPL